MALIVKSTIGYISQIYDTNTQKFISQDFTVLEPANFADEDGHIIAIAEGVVPDLAFELVQPDGGENMRTQDFVETLPPEPAGAEELDADAPQLDELDSFVAAISAEEME
jgi:hypothetical protein